MITCHLVLPRRHCVANDRELPTYTIHAFEIHTSKIPDTLGASRSHDAPIACVHGLAETSGAGSQRGLRQSPGLERSMSSRKRLCETDCRLEATQRFDGATALSLAIGAKE